MAKTGVQNYVGTLVFSIILLVNAIVIIGLLLLKVIPIQGSFFALTLVFGLILISSLAIYSIVTYEKKAKEETDSVLKSRLDVITCPDYYTRTSNNMCLNTYATTGANALTYTFPGARSIDLVRYNNKPMQDVCRVFTEDAYNNQVYLAQSNIIPWTYLSTKCDVL